MKREMVALVSAGILVIGGFVYAQIQGPFNQTQQSPIQLTACIPAHADAAVNTPVTLTITVPNGQSLYLCGLDLSVTNDATGGVVGTNVQFTSTNLWGWKYTYSMAGTANTVGVDRSFGFAHPIKSQAVGQAVTIISPAANAHAVYSVNAYYYTAP